MSPLFFNLKKIMIANLFKLMIIPVNFLKKLHHNLLYSHFFIQSNQAHEFPQENVTV